MRALAGIVVTAAALAAVGSPADAGVFRGSSMDDYVFRGTSMGDYVRGTAKRDRLLLRGGDDRGFGGRSADLLVGAKGDDRLFGGAGRDRLRGGRGRDLLRGGPGPDRLAGGSGADLLDARDRRRDRSVAAGPGTDICLVDRADRERGCERVVTTAPANASAAYGSWAPGPRDSCPRWLHDAYSVTGSDGLLYPTWHPPRIRNPASGKPCRFGHEHGRDPSGSRVARWVAGHLARDGLPRELPFGLANSALDEFAAAHPGTGRRHEDHVGHKVEWENGVMLQRATPDGGREPIGVRCDFLVKIHQGSHSPDALGNNLHELVYAVRCDDGTELLATKLVSFGEANEFSRSCDGATVQAGTSHSHPSGDGARLIPERRCIEEHLLVPPGEASDYSRGLYESWTASTSLWTADGHELARFDAGFGIFNPSRYALGSPLGSIGRVIDLCFAAEPGSGDTAHGGYCEVARSYGRVPFDSIRSAFDGARREVRVGEAEIANSGGPLRWYTDPYGGSASPSPFPGAICQLVGPRDNARPYPLAEQAFGAGRDYGVPGVHAPN